MSKIYVYVKGSFVTDDNALISVKERGFRFGDGVFETIRVSEGIPYQWDLHILRLKTGLELLKIDAEIDGLRLIGGLRLICDELLEKNDVIDGFLRISISRGEGSIGYLPDIKGCATVIVETIPLADEIDSPVDLWVSGYKKIPRDCLPAGAKTMQGLNSTLARMEAQENSCFEALLLNHDGQICEGSSSNIFWFKENTLFTPELTAGVIPGTIRDAVIRLSPFKVQEGIFSLDDIAGAEEVFLTNVAWLVASVKLIIPGDMIFDKFDVAGQIRELILEDAVTKND